MKDRNGATLEVGDEVFFKADVEQYGRIVEIRRGSWGAGKLVLEPTQGHQFRGEYIGGETRITEDADRCEKVDR